MNTTKSLFLGVFAIATLASNSFGQTIIQSLPYTISAAGTYVLGSNFIWPSATGQAITITKNNVTLDFGGHFIAFIGTPTSNIAVEVMGGNVTIQNGVIFNFFKGIEFTYSQNTPLFVSSGNIIQNLRLTNNVTSVHTVFTNSSIIRNNQIIGSGSGSGVKIEDGGGNVISGNVINQCTIGVVSLSTGNYAFENTVSNCSDIGFDLQPSDKYRFNTTFNCPIPFDGGTAVGAENN